MKKTDIINDVVKFYRYYSLSIVIFFMIPQLEGDFRVIYCLQECRNHSISELVFAK